MSNKVTFKVFTANPELLPQLEVYEIERGEFNSDTEAATLAREIMEAEGKHVQIKKCQTVYLEVDYCWYNSTHYQRTTVREAVFVDVTDNAENKGQILNPIA